MPITPQMVDYVARLSRLQLRDDEKELFAAQLGSILSFMDKLNELDTAHVEPMLHGVEGPAIMRPDVVGESLPREEALRNAPESSEGCFRVPKIIE